MKNLTLCACIKQEIMEGCMAKVNKMVNRENEIIKGGELCKMIN